MSERPNPGRNYNRPSAEERLATAIRRRQKYLRPPLTPPPPEVMADPRVPALMAEMDAFSVMSGWGLSLSWGHLHRGELEEAEASFLELKAGWLRDQRRRDPVFQIPTQIPDDCTGDLERCQCEWCHAVREVIKAVMAE